MPLAPAPLLILLRLALPLPTALQLPTAIPLRTTLPLPLAFTPWQQLAAAVGGAAVAVLIAVHLTSVLRRGPRASVGQHITRAGAVYLLLTLAVAIVALHTKINFLVLLFGMLLSGLVLSFILSRLAMRKLGLERVVPEGVHAGTPFTIELRVANRKRLLATYGLAVRESLPAGLSAERAGGVAVALRPGEAASLPYRATAVRRGVYRLTSLVYSTRFPFGLFHQGRAREAPAELVVYPRLGEVSTEFLGRAQALALAQRRSRAALGDEEFRNLRDYRHGDNPRRIHWKSSAKLGRPLVRELEAVASERVFILLDTRAPASGDPALEAAISFAATLARDLMLRGFFVSLAAYAPELVVTPPTKDPPGLRSLYETLARLEPAPRRALVELVGETRVRAGERVLTVATILRADDDAASAIGLLRAHQPRVLPVDVAAESFREHFLLA